MWQCHLGTAYFILGNSSDLQLVEMIRAEGDRIKINYCLEKNALGKDQLGKNTILCSQKYNVSSDRVKKWLLLYQLRISEIDIKVNTPYNDILVIRIVFIVRQIVGVFSVQTFDIAQVDKVVCHITDAGSDIDIQVGPGVGFEIGEGQGRFILVDAGDAAGGMGGRYEITFESKVAGRSDIIVLPACYKKQADR
jgi:hypothetical protein